MLNARNLIVIIEKHGPYYYAYWKDPETKRLKKKYIGRHFDRDNLPANKEQVKTCETTTPQPESDRLNKKKKKGFSYCIVRYLVAIMMQTESESGTVAFF